MREKKEPPIHDCSHPYPIEVAQAARARDEKQAWCLTCGAAGPASGDSLEAVRALKDESWVGATAEA